MPPEGDTKTDAPAPTDPPVVTPPEPTPVDPPKDTDWKAEARKWEQRAKDNKKALDEAAPKLKAFGEIEAASKTELEKAKEAAEQYENRMVDVLSRAVRAEVRSRSAGFINPDVPFAFLDISEFIDDKGEIDTAKIDTELKGLLDKKPELARPAGTRVPGPNPAQGSSASGAPDVEAQKAAALKAGDWKTVMRLENQKLNAPQGS